MFVFAGRVGHVLDELTILSHRFEDIVTMSDNRFHVPLALQDPGHRDIEKQIKNILDARVGAMGTIILNQTIGDLNIELFNIDREEVVRLCDSLAPKLITLFGAKKTNKVISEIMDIVK